MCTIIRTSWLPALIFHGDAGMLYTRSRKLIELISSSFHFIIYEYIFFCFSSIDLKEIWSKFDLTYSQLDIVIQVKVPLYGCDCYAYALLASGFVDLVIESGLKVIGQAALCIFIHDHFFLNSHGQ